MIVTPLVQPPLHFAVESLPTSLNLASLLRNSGLRQPDAPAVIADDVRMRNSELDDAARRFAGDLLAAGVCRGDKVAIVDRQKDLIIRGGYNVYPREVEEALYSHPAVAEAAVIGVPDGRLGEEVKAVIALRPRTSVTPDEFVQHCKGLVVAYKYPRIVKIIDSLPKGPTGKILKRALRDS